MAQDEGCYFCGKERSCDRCRPQPLVTKEHVETATLDIARGGMSNRIEVTTACKLCPAICGTTREMVDHLLRCHKASMRDVYGLMRTDVVSGLRSAVEGVGKAQETETLAGTPQPTKDP